MLERILDESKKRGLNDQDLCKILDTHKSKIYDWKKGRSEPTAREVHLLAEYFGVTADYLLTGKIEFPAHSVDAEGIVVAIAPGLLGVTLEQYFGALGDIPKDEPMYERLCQIKEERVCPTLYEAIHMAEILQQEDRDVPPIFISLIVEIANSRLNVAPKEQPPTDKRAADVLQEKLAGTVLVGADGALSERGLDVIVDFLIDNLATLQKLAGES